MKKEKRRHFGSSSACTASKIFGLFFSCWEVVLHISAAVGALVPKQKQIINSMFPVLRNRVSSCSWPQQRQLPLGTDWEYVCRCACSQTGVSSKEEYFLSIRELPLFLNKQSLFLFLRRIKICSIYLTELEALFRNRTRFVPWSYTE